MRDVHAAPDFLGFTVSRDGRFLAFSRSEHLRHEGLRRARLVVAALDACPGDATPAEIRPFGDAADAWSAEFADDGISLLFLTDLSGEARPWVALERGAAPAEVAAVGRMAMAPKWRPGLPRRGFAFLSFATRAEQGVPDPIPFGETPAAGFRHLFQVDEPQPGVFASERRITQGPEDVYDFAWSPDGARLAVLVAPNMEMERRLDNELRVIEADSGRVIARFTTERGLNGYLSWSPDGTRLAYIAHGPQGRVGKPDLFTLRLADGALGCLSRDVPGWVSHYDWAPCGEGLLFPASQGTTSVLYAARLDAEGERQPPRVILAPRGHIGGLSVSKGARRLALRLEGPRTPPRLCVCDLGPLDDPSPLGPLRVVTARSARREARVPGEADIVQTRAPDGKPVEAVLLRPRKADGARRPVCVWLHGGPNEFCALSYQPWWHLFVARGFAVLAPNYRGSGSYNTARVRWNVGDLGEGDASDVVACLDAVAGRDDLDVSRIVLFGWSYGAHLAMHVARRLGRRDREAGMPCAVRRVIAGGGLFDWLSHYGQTDLRFPWRDYLRASPLRDATEADRRSPVRFAAELGSLLGDAEVLLAHGLADGRVHVSQSRVMHRALLEAGVRSTFLMYPREGHVIVEPDHVADLLERATRPL